MEKATPLCEVLVTHISEAAIIVDEAGIICFANPSAQKLFGEDDLIGTTFGIPVASEKACEIKIVSSNLSPLTAEMRAVPVEWQKKSATLVLMQDITARKNALERIQEHESFLDNILENVPIGVGRVGKGRVIEKVNNYICNLTGYTEEELVNQNARIFYPDDQEFEAVGKENYRQLEKAGISSLDTHWLTKDGRIIDVLLRSTALYPGHPRDGYTFSVLDVTARQKIERELRESRQFLQQVIDHIPQAVFWKDKQLNYLGGNREFLRDAGVKTINELIGKNDFDLDWKELAEIYRADDASVLSSGKARLNYEEDQANLDDRLFRTSKVPMENEKGEIIALLGIYEEITEQKRIEKEMQQRLAELEAIKNVSMALRMSEELDELLPLLLEQTLSAIHTSTGAIWLIDIKDGTLKNSASKGWVSQIDKETFSPGDSVVGTVYETGKAHICEEFAVCELIPEDQRSVVPHHWGGACVPIRYSSTTIVGVLCVSVEHPRVLSNQEIALLHILAEMAGSAIHRTRLLDQTETQLKNITAINAVERAIGASFEINVTLNVLLEQLLNRLKVDAACVLLMHPISRSLKYTVGRGFRTQEVEKTQLSPGQGLPGRVSLERRMIYLKEVDNLQMEIVRPTLFKAEGFVAYIAVPLISKGKIKGILEIFNRAPLSIGFEWDEFVESLAIQAATAIDNAEIFEGLQRANLELSLAYDTTIEIWVRAVDRRDMGSEDHLQKTIETTTRLARLLGIRDTDLVHIRRGAMLHDIGHLMVPEYILQKNAPLTEDERELVQQHPDYAREMLAPISQLNPAIDIPYCHHERWDGSGYPRGLSGTQIPLPGRLFAIVDVWTTLRSDRPYRKAWDFRDAKDYLQSQAGILFDPEIVEVFLNHVNAHAEL
jgi:PAS domain S-box-containing protein